MAGIAKFLSYVFYHRTQTNHISPTFFRFVRQASRQGCTWTGRNEWTFARATFASNVAFKFHLFKFIYNLLRWQLSDCGFCRYHPMIKPAIT